MTINITLDPRRAALLDRLASELDLDPAAVVRVWIADRVDRTHLLADVGATASSRGARSARPAPRSRRPQAGVAAAASRGGERRRGSLHDEVIRTLEERGEPMSVAEIAEAIRRRGRYLSPRTQTPVTSVSVSQRIAHPRYRPLFKREGRRIGLVGGSK